MRHESVREHGRFARSEAGCRGIELGEDGRGARIEYDSRSERERKSGRRYRRQGNPGRVDRGRKGRQYAVYRVIRDAQFGGMVDRRDALAAALGLRHVVLHVRQRVQLRGLLGKYQRSGEKQADVKDIGASLLQLYSPYSFCFCSRRDCASMVSVAVGRAISLGMPIGSPVSSQ